jgi:hypothetical protein
MLRDVTLYFLFYLGEMKQNPVSFARYHSLLTGFVLPLPISEFHFISYWLLLYGFKLLLEADR